MVVEGDWEPTPNVVEGRLGAHPYGSGGMIGSPPLM